MKAENREYCGDSRLESRNNHILEGHYEPQNELEQKRLKQRARGYAVVDGELYKSGVTKPWLRCITSEKGVELLKEIHSGFCGAHIGTRALAGKDFTFHR
jgi:hypothetical protein